MTRLAGLVVLPLFALPASASDPIRARMEKSRPTQSAEPPLALPIPPAPPPPAFGERVLKIVLCSGQVLANVVVRGGDHDLNECRSFLNGESSDLRQAREEFHRFWMNNQPSVLSYERLNGAIGP